jgi:hypothetical protein
MKKLVLSLAAATLLFASCTKEETTSVIADKNPNSIGFDLSTGKAGTRAATANLAALKGDASGIGIYATNTSSATEFIANAGYKWNASGSKWGWDGTEQAWPTTEDGYPINFYAYYPKSGTTLSTTLTAQYNIGQNTVASPQKDLLAANQTGIVNRPASSNVALNFKHILSKVDFKVKAGAGMTVEVQSIAVHSAGSIRTFDYSTLTWNTAAPTTNVNYSYMAAPVVPANIFAGQSPAVANSVTGTSGSLMLLPQNFSARAWDKTAATISTASYIEVVYRMTETATGDDVVGYTNAKNHPDFDETTNAALDGKPLFVKVGFPLNTNWLMGKAYTYTINLGTPSSSGGNLVDDNFMDENGDDSGLPVVDPSDEDEKNIPDPIVDITKPIDFTVSVTDWTDASGVTLE